MAIKYLKLINPKVWFDNLIMKTFINKGIKHLATGLAGAVSGIMAEPLVSKTGVKIDETELTVFLIGAFTALYGWIMNWAKDAANEKKTDPVVAEIKASGVVVETPQTPTAPTP